MFWQMCWPTSGSPSRRTLPERANLQEAIDAPGLWFTVIEQLIMNRYRRGAHSV
jgi:hypothetical protein